MADKKTRIICLCLLLGGWGLMAALPPATEAEHDFENQTAREILRHSTRLIPREPMLLSGTLTVRRQRGITLLEHPFKLLLDWGAAVPAAELLLLERKGTTVVERVTLTRPEGEPAAIQIFEGLGTESISQPSYTARVRGTDMTWLDLTLDFLWWPEARFDDVPRGESRNGRDCDIIVTVPPWPLPGCSAVRVWVDRKLGCMMQMEQLDPQGRAVRKMWVQRVKKMDERWMIRDMEVESLNSGHRTRLFVDDAVKP